MGRGSASTDGFPASRKKAIRTVKGSVVYARKKHEMRARDVLRMANRLQFPIYVKDCEAQWDLLSVALRLTENMMMDDSIFVVRVETQRQVWQAMRAWIARHPFCIGMVDSTEFEQRGAVWEDPRPWWQRLLQPFDPNPPE